MTNEQKETLFSAVFRAEEDMLNQIRVTAGISDITQAERAEIRVYKALFDLTCELGLMEDYLRWLDEEEEEEGQCQEQK